MKPTPLQTLIAIVGALVGLSMAFMKFLPFVPGHFSRWEWVALGVWIILGTLIGRSKIVRPNVGQTSTAGNAVDSGFSL
jgi:hypothetical protein